MIRINSRNTITSPDSPTLMGVIDGDKTGSHWIRTALCIDESGKCKPRNNENVEILARLVVIDGDRGVNANGEEIEGAPDPLKVSEILRVNNIGHILYGSYSHYAGERSGSSNTAINLT